MRVASVITAMLLTSTLAVASGAHAASVVYTDANNVWSASPDGAVKRQVTTNGTADVYWLAASQADTGMILAFLKSGGDAAMTYMNPDGSPIRSGLAATYPIGGSTCSSSVAGPVNSRLNAAGTLAAYSLVCNRFNYVSGSVSYDSEVYSVVAGTQTVGAGLFIPDVWFPTFVAGSAGPDELGEKILASPAFTNRDGDVVLRVPLKAPLVYEDVISADPGGDVSRADVTRDGSRVALIERLPTEPAAGLFVYGRSAPLGAPGDWTSGCRVPTGPNPGLPSWSPDGQMLAWSDDEGAKVITITSAAGSAAAPPPCGVGGTVLLSPTGRGPVFSGAPTLVAATAPPTTPRAPRLAFSAPTSITRSALRSRGLSVRTRCARACTVRAVMKAGRRVVARGSKRLTRRGTVVLTLRAKPPRTVKSVTISVTSGAAVGIRVVRITG